MLHDGCGLKNNKECGIRIWKCLRDDSFMVRAAVLLILTREHIQFK